MEIPDITIPDANICRVNTTGKLMVCLCEKSCKDGYLNLQGLEILCKRYGVEGALLYYADKNGEHKPVKIKSK